MSNMERLFLESALTTLGQHLALTFTEVINRYPPQLRPVVIGQMEAFVAATRATFSEKEIEIADGIRDLSKVITIVKNRPEENEK